MFTNSKINLEDPVDSWWNLADLAFQTVKFPRGFRIFLILMAHLFKTLSLLFLPSLNFHPILLYSLQLISFFLLILILILWDIMGLAAESQFHVLAVDDSIIDRKLIETLLKTSSYQGKDLIHIKMLEFMLFLRSKSLILVFCYVYSYCSGFWE